MALIHSRCRSHLLVLKYRDRTSLRAKGASLRTGICCFAEWHNLAVDQTNRSKLEKGLGASSLRCSAWLAGPSLSFMCLQACTGSVLLRSGLLSLDLADQTLQRLLHMLLHVQLRVMHLLLEMLGLCISHLQHHNPTYRRVADNDLLRGPGYLMATLLPWLDTRHRAHSLCRRYCAETRQAGRLHSMKECTDYRKVPSATGPERQLHDTICQVYTCVTTR